MGDPLQLPVLGTAATLQLLVLTEKPALAQSEPKLKSLVVAAVAGSAEAFEVPVRTVRSEPERMAEKTALAAAEAAAQVRENTAQHLWTASAVMLWQADILVSVHVGECESQYVLHSE